MPLAMNRDVFVTCAVTGSGASQERSARVIGPGAVRERLGLVKRAPR